MVEQGFQFGPFKLSPSSRVLERDGQQVKIGGKAFDLLLALVERQGSVMSRDELVAAVWPDTIVDDGSLRVLVSVARRALGEEKSSARYLKSVTGKGYMFAAQARRTGLGIAATGARRTIPSLLTRVIGRRDVINPALGHLSKDRMVTIAGPGGVGKTTVALAIANAVYDDYRDGVFFVDLAVLRKSDQVAVAVASAVGAVVKIEDQISAITSHLRGKQLLLVLDNCEHLVDAAATLAEAMLAAIPEIHVVATSREPLNVRGEWLRRLLPLRTPTDAPEMTPQDILKFPSVEMFIERVTATHPIDLTPEDIHSIASICRKLDGIPLAIEFAASRIEEFGFQGVDTRLSDRFGLLTRGRRTALPRHRTLRQTMDWSHALLSAQEKMTFQRLAAFAGWFPPSAVSSLFVEEEVDPLAIAADLASLVAKSLLTVEAPGGLRYRMLETTRDYAASELDTSDERDVVRKRHAIYCLEALKVAATEWADADPKDWLTKHGSLLGDVRTALSWAFNHEDEAITAARLTAASSLIFTPLGLLDEHREDIERAIDVNRQSVEPDHLVEARLYGSLGAILYHTQAHVKDDRARAAFRHSYESAMESGNTELQLRAISGLSAANILRGDYAEALRVGEAFGPLPGGFNSHVAHRTLAHSKYYAGDFAEAGHHLVAALEKSSGKQGIASAGAQFEQRQVTLRSTLAAHLWMSGHADQAVEVAQECVADALEFEHAMALCHTVAASAFPISFCVLGHEQAAAYVETFRAMSERHSMVMYNQLAQVYHAMMTPRLARAGTREAQVLNHHSNMIDGSHVIILAALGDAFTEAWMVDRAYAAQMGWCKPEVLRAKGFYKMQVGERREAEMLFRSAIDEARSMGALAWELRASESLGRELAERGERRQAHDLMARVLDKFTEGFQALDYVRARQLLNETG